MNQPTTNLPGLLLDLRRQLAISQEDLARQLGVSFATVNRWENGRAHPSRLAQTQLMNFRRRMIAQRRVMPTGDPAE